MCTHHTRQQETVNLSTIPICLPLYCSACAEPISDVFFEGSPGIYYCNYCWSVEIITTEYYCPNCRTAHESEHTRRDGPSHDNLVSDEWNEGCVDCLSWCEECDAYYPADECCQRCADNDDCDRDDYLDCVSDAADRVYPYETKPTWAHGAQPWENTTFLGVELEMQFSTSRENLALKNKLNSRAFWKYDGSIGGSGAELVTDPLTLQYHKQLNWHAFLKSMHDIGAKSHDTGTCGLHVHVSKNSFGGRHNVSKLCRFFLNNQDQITRFSKRKQSRIHSMCSFGELIDVHPAQTYRHYSAHCGNYNKDRYSAINVCHKTVELRIFNGTLKHDRFVAVLQFCDAIVKFVRGHGYSSMAWSIFYDFLCRDNSYCHLVKYLQRENICA